MLKQTAATLFGAALLALPLAVSAAGAQERPAFDEADDNGDGRISVEEATAVGVPKSEAKREDIDNDGKLTKADWKFVDMKKSGSESSS